MPTAVHHRQVGERRRSRGRCFSACSTFGVLTHSAAVGPVVLQCCHGSTSARAARVHWKTCENSVRNFRPEAGSFRKSGGTLGLPCALHCAYQSKFSSRLNFVSVVSAHFPSGEPALHLGKSADTLRGLLLSKSITRTRTPSWMRAFAVYRILTTQCQALVRSLVRCFLIPNLRATTRASPAPRGTFTSRDNSRLGGAEQGARGGVVGDHAVASEEDAAGAHASRTNQGGGSSDPRPRTRSMSSPLAASLAAALRVQTVSCP